MHIPFCEYHCSFCDFATFVGQDRRMPAYTDALLAELRLRTLDGPRRTASTIFFGGGTPSTLPVVELERILAGLADTLPFAGDLEVSLEANPGLPDLASWQALRAAGITRLSIGIQSLDDDVLRAVERRHTAAEAVTALKLARKAGFRSVNVDLIYGLPGQDRASWQRTLREVLDHEPDHISVYGLIVEPGTLLLRQVRRGAVTLPDDDTAAAMYEYTRESLSAHAYVQYEMSNWARSGHQCLHNLTYWRHDPYLGLGLSAHSFLDGVRFSNLRGLQGYLNRLAAHRLPTAHSERITPARARGDAAMVGLRLVEGIHLASFNARFGGDLLADKAEAIGRLSEYGLIEVVGGCLRLTSRAYLLANQVWQEFV